MAPRVNYGFQKAERDRAKREKKEEKARQKAAAQENEKAAAGSSAGPSPTQPGASPADKI